MRVGTLVGVFAAASVAAMGSGLLGLAGCGGAQTNVGSSVGEVDSATPQPVAPPASASAAPAASAKPAASASPSASASTEPPGPPPPDPAEVKALVDRTGESPEVDNPLHLRLEITPHPAGELWILAVVNRGTEPARVLFDLSKLTLEAKKPDDTAKPRGKWQKPAAPIVCKLPEGFGGAAATDQHQTLAPGEGLVQTFDPRLYCISAGGDSLLATGQIVTAKLGFKPAPPRHVWKKGGATEQASPQSAPFVAEPEAKVEGKIDPENDPRVKQLVGNPVTLTADLTANEAEQDPTLPLELKLVRGSDAATEMTSTVVVELRAKQKTPVYFRRELVTFTVHGPEGIRVCDPQPDEKVPDRSGYTTLAPGQSVSATSLLAELCPKYTFGRPGIYWVTARMDSTRDGSEFGLAAFTGRLESRHVALVRIRSGELPALPPPEPLRVKVGGSGAGADGAKGANTNGSQ